MGFAADIRGDSWDTVWLACEHIFTAFFAVEMMAKVWGRVEATGDGALLNTHYYSMRFAAVGPNAARL